MYKPLATRRPNVDPEQKSKPPHLDTLLASPKKNQLHVKLNTALIIGVYCICGTAMTLVNKVAIGQFPFPDALIAVQNVVAVAVLLSGSVVMPSKFGRMPALTKHTLREWIPIVFLFVGILLSSLMALMKVSAVTLIVIRNLISCTVAFFEYTVLKHKVGPRGVASLVGILGGATLYAMYDITFDAFGYAWLLVNIVATTAYQVSVKRLITSQASKEMGPLGCSFVKNTLSTPVMLLLCAASGVGRQLAHHAVAGVVAGNTMAVILLSGVLGICLSITGFMLNARISATSIMVANNVNKVRNEGVGRATAAEVRESMCLQWPVLTHPPLPLPISISPPVRSHHCQRGARSAHAQRTGVAWGCVCCFVWGSVRALEKLMGCVCKWNAAVLFVRNCMKPCFKRSRPDRSDQPSMPASPAACHRC